MATTRSKSRNLSEEELGILTEQLDRKREQLQEQERIIREREAQAQERISALQALEEEHNNRDHTQPGPSEPPIMAEQFSSIQRTLSQMIAQFGDLKNEVTQIKNEGRPPSQSPPLDHHNADDFRRELNPNIKFKDALESVPTFNGYNIPVLRFIRSCKRARDMFSPHLESSLTQLLRNKLKGHAATALEDYVFDNVTDFADRLKTLFGAAKTLNEFRGELGNISKNPSEHIIDYISRVKDLHTAIREAEVDSHGFSSRENRSSLNSDTLDCFIKGLPPDFRMRLKLESFLDLEDAFTKAIKVEKDIERDRTHFKDNRAESKPHTVQVKAFTPSGRATCAHCGRPHPSENCWQKFPEKRPAHIPPYRNNIENPNENRANSERENRQRPPCPYCLKPGHSEAMCYKKQNDERNKVTPESKNANSRPAARASPRDEPRQERPVKLIEAQLCAPSGSS